MTIDVLLNSDAERRHPFRLYESIPRVAGEISADIAADGDLVLHLLPSHIQARGTHHPLFRTHFVLNFVPGTVLPLKFVFLKLKECVYFI